MAPRISNSILFLLFGCYFFVQIQAFRQPKCRGKETKLTEDEMKLMTECLQEFVKAGSNNNFADIPKDSIGCIGKCILQRQGLVDENGKPLKDNIFKMVNATLDAEIAEIADEKLGVCIDQHSSAIDNSADGCKTYWPLVQCVGTAFIEICMKPASSTPASA